MMRRASALLAAALSAIAVVPASAYYHFIYYLPSGNAPAKFDLTALPNKTVSFFVSEAGPTSYVANDNFSNVVGQIRQAVQVWNGVSSSDLRVTFGGFENSATQQNTPAADVVFEDLPPGLLGYGGPTILAAPVTPATGTPWVPISRSAIHLNLNETIAPGPSFNESFFMTVVHEMGHALGLQHTFTSSTMSTATTRATSLMNPIDTDDIAGLSTLYPNGAATQTGSISGHITSGGAGVHMESVVAIRAGFGAISAITNPDGSYQIDGIPPGQYYVYAHALPPDADIKGPWNPDGSIVAASGPTNSLFYPGVTNPNQAGSIAVTAGAVQSGIDIALTSIASLPIYDAGVYGFYAKNTVTVKPAYLNMLAGEAVAAASGVGLGANGKAPGLTAAFLGNSATIAPNGVVPYQASGFTYIGLYILYPLFATTGPQHLVFNEPGFMHVLPSAVRLTQQNPPTIDSVTANADGTLAITGSNWTAGSLIYFDGLPSAASSVTVDPKTASGTATVTPPPGMDTQTAILTLYNPDGQSSQFVQSASPATYTYGGASAQTISSVSPATLPAGAEAVIDILGSGFSFAPGQVAVGLGSSDVVVRKVFVIDANHLQADVSVSANASLTTTDVSVFNGFRTATATAGFRVTAAVNGLPAVYPILTNALPGLNGSYAGAIVSLYGVNLAAAKSAPVLTFNGETATLLYSSPSQVNLQIPTDLAPGLTLMKLNNGAMDAYPVVVNIDPQPAAITSVLNIAGNPVGGPQAAVQGDLLTVNLTGFAPDGTTIDPSRVQIGMEVPAGTPETMHAVLSVSQTTPGTYQLTFLLNTDEPTDPSESMVVYLDGHSSYPIVIPVSTQSGTFGPVASAARH